MELKVVNDYQLNRKIGSGSFGEIYHGINRRTGEEVAIKLELATGNTKVSQLLNESAIYGMINWGDVGIPKMKWCGTVRDYNVLVMELLGPSLENLFTSCNKHFCLKTVTSLAVQLISRIESLHMHGFIHRDIKPDNLLMGLGEQKNLVYIIDFGLAQSYRKIGSLEHIPYRENKPICGTLQYLSINAHFHKEQSRRDDLESIGYVLMYFIRGGSLPWKGLVPPRSPLRFRKIAEKKVKTPVEELCEGCPQEFAIYLKYCRGLHFSEKPDYEFLKDLFRGLSYRLGSTSDHEFEWNKPKFDGYRHDEGGENRERRQEIPDLIPLLASVSSTNHLAGGSQQVQERPQLVQKPLNVIKMARVEAGGDQRIAPSGSASNLVGSSRIMRPPPLYNFQNQAKNIYTASPVRRECLNDMTSAPNDQGSPAQGRKKVNMDCIMNEMAGRLRGTPRRVRGGGLQRLGGNSSAGTPMATRLPFS